MGSHTSSGSHEWATREVPFGLGLALCASERARIGTCCLQAGTQRKLGVRGARRHANPHKSVSRACRHHGGARVGVDFSVVQTLRFPQFACATANLGQTEKGHSRRFVALRAGDSEVLALASSARGIGLPIRTVFRRSLDGSSPALVAAPGDDHADRERRVRNLFVENSISKKTKKIVARSARAALAAAVALVRSF